MHYCSIFAVLTCARCKRLVTSSFVAMCIFLYKLVKQYNMSFLLLNNWVTNNTKTYQTFSLISLSISASLGGNGIILAAIVLISTAFLSETVLYKTIQYNRHQNSSSPSRASMRVLTCPVALRIFCIFSSVSIHRVF